MTQKKGGAVNLSTVNIGKSIAKVKGKGGTAADNGGVYAFNAEEVVLYLLLKVKK